MLAGSPSMWMVMLSSRTGEGTRWRKARSKKSWPFTHDRAGPACKSRNDSGKLVGAGRRSKAKSKGLYGGGSSPNVHVSPRR